MNECVLPFQTKLGIVKFLASGVMTDSDILVHLIVAAADTRFSVANAADMQLKKTVGLVREFICVGWHMGC
jgi:proteasome component ECM29